MMERPPPQQPRSTINLNKVPSPKKRRVAHTPPAAIQCAELAPSPKMPALVATTPRKRSTLNRPTARVTPPRQAANTGPESPRTHRQPRNRRDPAPALAPTRQAAYIGPKRQPSMSNHRVAATAPPPAELNSSSSSSDGENMAKMQRRLLRIIQRTHQRQSSQIRDVLTQLDKSNAALINDLFH